MTNAKPANIETRRRPATERMAIQALVSYPDLAEQFAIAEQDFDDPTWRRLMRSLSSAARTSGNSASLAHLCADSDLELDHVASLFTATFQSAEQGRLWVRRLADIALGENLRAEVDSAFASLSGADLTARLARIATSRHPGTETAERDMADVVLSQLDERLRMLAEGRSSVIPSGFDFLDRAIRGWMPCELTALVASGGVGKTTFADWLRVQLARRKIATLTFSGEMSEWQSGERAIHAEAGRPMGDDLTAEDLDRVRLAAKSSSSVWRYMKIEFASRFSGPSIRARIGRALEREGSIGLVIFDHLRHFENSGRTEYERVSEAIREAKAIAKDLAVPLLMLTHFSRARKEEAQRADGGVPTLEAIRGSGQIEEESDNVIALWRQRQRDGEPRQDAQLHVLKARQTGRLVATTLPYDFRSQSFRAGIPVGGT